MKFGDSESHGKLRVPTASSAKGKELLKEVRTHLKETVLPLMEAMVSDISGVKIVSLYHDISTVTGEELVVFTLAEAPQIHGSKRKGGAPMVCAG